MGTLQKTTGDEGRLLMFGDGTLMNECCCGGPAPNPCSPQPEMLLTVTGSSGTINWCGQTWNLPGDSGVQKSVCPTTYLDSYITQPFPQYTCNPGWRHRWWFQSTGGKWSLVLDAQWLFGWTFFSFYRANVHNRVIVQAGAGSLDKRRKAHITSTCAATPNIYSVGSETTWPFTTTIPGMPSLQPNTGVASFGLGPASTKTTLRNTTTTACAFNLTTLRVDGHIHPVFFGSMTDTNGVTFKWEKGQGWP